MRMQCGCFFFVPVACHPKNASAGMRQRRRLNALRKDGLVATVSLRALMSRLPIFGSSAQDGTRPQRSMAAVRTRSAARIVNTGCVGETL
jgi:hypothetical protein